MAWHSKTRLLALVGPLTGERHVVQTANHPLDPEKMLSFYKQNFANAANFTFFFVGTFTVDAIAPLLEQYLGSLPSRGSPDARKGEMHLEFPKSVVRETVTKGQEPRSQTVITFFADTGLEEMETNRLQAATEVLEMRLRRGRLTVVTASSPDASPWAKCASPGVGRGSCSSP